jgi:DNA-binding LytR/AlgR family response regulator
MVEVAICDDEPLLVRSLKRLIQDSAQVIPEPLHIRVFTRGADLLVALLPPDDAGRPP